MQSYVHVVTNCGGLIRVYQVPANGRTVEQIILTEFSNPDWIVYAAAAKTRLPTFSERTRAFPRHWNPVPSVDLKMVYRKPSFNKRPKFPFRKRAAANQGRATA